MKGARKARSVRRESHLANARVARIRREESAAHRGRVRRGSRTDHPRAFRRLDSGLTDRMMPPPSPEGLPHRPRFVSGGREAEARPAAEPPAPYDAALKKAARREAASIEAVDVSPPA